MGEHRRAMQAKRWMTCRSWLRPNDKCFCSMDENGKLLKWSLTQEGWQSIDEINIPSLPTASALGWPPHMPHESAGFIAGHSSRLAPQLTVVVDQNLQLFACFDQSKASNGLSSNSTISYACR